MPGSVCFYKLFYICILKHSNISHLHFVFITLGINNLNNHLGNIAIMSSTPSSNMASQVTSRMQPVMLSIDSNPQGLQNFALVAAPTVVAAAVGSSECRLP